MNLKKTKADGCIYNLPDYLGNTADIEGISKVCEECDIPLIVDNAHGAYQAFLDEKSTGQYILYKAELPYAVIRLTRHCLF